MFDSGGPVFYRQIRLGKNGKRFGMLKFRTMTIDKYSNSQEEGLLSENLKSGSRTIRIGNFLQRTSLDEIPQFWNVFKGEMSLVGPRPLLLSQLDMFDDKHLDDLKTVMPGITGLWQVNGTATIDSLIQLDQYYIKNWSLWLDIRILVKTITNVFRQTGAY